MPERIQRKRTKGFKLPSGCIYVGRPSKWGNPYKVGEWGEYADPAQKCVELFDEMLTEMLEDGDQFVNGETVWEWLAPLRGKDLACWCPLYDKDGARVPCHADVLLRLANTL
jgi:hypothetical protein